GRSRRVARGARARLAGCTRRVAVVLAVAVVRQRGRREQSRCDREGQDARDTCDRAAHLLTPSVVDHGGNTAAERLRDAYGYGLERVKSGRRPATSAKTRRAGRRACPT